MTTIIINTGPLPTHFVVASVNPSLLKRPFALCKVPAGGFASPARDYKAKSLDLNELMVRNAPATFFWEVHGYSMRDAGINHGDIAVVDRSIEAANGSIIVADVNGEVTIKRLYLCGDVVELHPANPNYEPIRFQEDDQMTPWGVVTFIIRKFKA